MTGHRGASLQNRRRWCRRRRVGATSKLAIVWGHYMCLTIAHGYVSRVRGGTLDSTQGMGQIRQLSSWPHHTARGTPLGTDMVLDSTKMNLLLYCLYPSAQLSPSNYLHGCSLYHLGRASNERPIILYSPRLNTFLSSSHKLISKASLQIRVREFKKNGRYYLLRSRFGSGPQPMAV